VNPVNKRIILFLGLILLAIFASFYIPFPKETLNADPVISLRITDRNGLLLREVLSEEGGRCLWLKPEEISPYLILATLAAEDKHFFLHPGFDITAVFRACVQNIKAGKIVSGASTITQQLMRNVTRHRRHIFSKVYETWLALRLEKALTKEEILIQYLNRISYGNQAYGVEAASHLYLDKPASDLSLAEAAFLAGLPRSPLNLNPYRHFERAKKRQEQILRRMFRAEHISENTLARALEERICLIPEARRFRAPHFCDYVLRQIPGPARKMLGTIKTTLDYALQERVEAIVKKHIDAAAERGITNSAVLILDNHTGEILAMVGSRDFFDHRHDGQVNGTLSLRQPGSTLKPFTYGLALERGMTAATILEDTEIHIKTQEGIFRPKNYDQRYHGLIRLRSALACSYNIPAVSVLQGIGPDLLYQRLRRLGFSSLKKSPSFYGVGLTLGNGEVTLLELVRAYSALARGGAYRAEKSIVRLNDFHQRIGEISQGSAEIRLFPASIAYILTHILSDPDARTPSFGVHSPLNLPFPCAVKTGTSKDFRDNWTIGYTSRYCVGVWAGNFDGQPMHRVSGITGCGPLFKDIMLHLHRKGGAAEFQEPEGLVHRKICPLSGKLATPECPGDIQEIFIRGTEPDEPCDHDHLHRLICGDQGLLLTREKSLSIHITFPVHGDLFKIDPILPPSYQTIQFQAAVVDRHVNHVEWWINGRRTGVTVSPYSLSWQLKPGSYTIKVTARAGEKNLESRPVKFTVLS